METEIEAKFLDIDAAAMREKLTAMRAVCIYPERIMRRRVFDYPDRRLEQIGGWIRVRDEGEGKITLSYKRTIDRTLHGTKEICLDVSDFETMCNLFLAIGLESKSYQETKREKWEIDDVEVTIDTWPWIPTFVELESLSEEKLKTAAARMGFNWSDAMHGAVGAAYQKYFDITEEDLNSWESITFIPVPEWLEIKRKSLS